VEDEESAPVAEPAGREPLHILLAEDSPVNQKVAVSMLERRGHRVVVAANGVEAVAAARSQTFDLVLMDVQMPEMDGLAATAAIRTYERATGAHVPIVAMTANAMHGDRERCLAAGMDDYVAKPIRARDLMARIEAVVGASAAARAGGGTMSQPANEQPSQPAPRELPDGAGSAVETRAPMALDIALDAVGGSREGLRELADLFFQEAPALLTRIREALAAGDASALRHAAHTLKGAAAVFGADPTSDLARELEYRGRDEALDDAERDVARLQTEVDRLLTALRAALET